MFFFIHGEIFVGVTFHTILLILEHIFLHGHELRDSICFEIIEQMFKLIFEMFCILIHHLRHHIPFLLVLGLTLLMGLVEELGILLGLLLLFFVAVDRLVLFLSVIRAVPVAGELVEIIEVGLID